MTTSTERTRELRSHFSLTGEVPSHGVNGYAIGCRCQICRQKNNDYQREWRDKNKPADWDGEDYYGSSRGAA